MLALQKLRHALPLLYEAAQRESIFIEDVFTCCAAGQPSQNAMSAPPPATDPSWWPLKRNQLWGHRPGQDPTLPPDTLQWFIPKDGGANHWLRAQIALPAGWRGHDVYLATTFGGAWLQGIEAILYYDGQTLAGLDNFHREALLPASAQAGEHEILIRAYVPTPQKFDGLRLARRDQQLFRLAVAMKTLLGVAEHLPTTTPARQQLMAGLLAAYNSLDLREGHLSQAYAESGYAALAQLDSLVAALGNSGELRPTMLSTGHAHLDVAWLWPLWRTRQKVVHTVATALQLMARYPEYVFSMSQPQVYDYIRQDDPDLFARLAQSVGAGQLEPLGMMWLEPDCNLTSGESLVRQMIHGARFWRQHFGAQAVSRTVFLPDVFGYSAALPQLMRLCGVDCFVTTKISWNQFNRIPVDTFRWRGIDGSEVLAHFVTATDNPSKHHSDPQGYTYNGEMTAAEVHGTWNHYRQKAVNDQLLYIYGHGDGGGGPTAEMLEAARLMRDLPGFPQVQMGSVNHLYQPSPYQAGQSRG
jgi:alpha-mannosidase